MLNWSHLSIAVITAILLSYTLQPVNAQDELHDRIEALLAQIRPYGLYGNERAANALLDLAPSMDTARPELIAALDDPHMVVRWASARVMGTIGPPAHEAVPALAQSLTTSEWYTQVMIAWALSRMGPAAASATPALAETLGSSKNVWVKRETAVALGTIGPAAREALPQLIAALEDDNGFVRVAAATSLYLVDGDARGLPLLIEALEDPFIVGPRFAADALAELNEGARPALPQLVAVLEDPAAGARVAAARALWLIDGDTRGIEVLTKALTAVEPEVRERAWETLNLISQATGQQFTRPPTPEETTPQPLVFHAEEWSEPRDAFVENRWQAGKWNLWTDGAPAWSRGVVLAVPSVTEDRTSPEEGAPMLHTRLTGIPPGSYDVTVEHIRSLGVSLDGGETWRKLTPSGFLGTFEIQDGTFELWIDDRYAADGAPGPHYYNTVTFTPAVETPEKPPTQPVQGWADERVRERLTRSPVAIRTEEGVYLSWRLLTEDPDDIAFDVLRADGGGPARTINDTPITATTDFLDRTAPPGGDSLYTIVPADGMASSVPAATVAAPAEELPYISIKLQGDYLAQTVAVGDLTGDGRMDYVIKQPDTQIWGFLYTWYRSPDTYKLEAYTADGEFMWRQSMGWGIEMGLWFSPFIVHDLNGDGYAEVIHKGADPDPRDAEGMCNQGDEYVVVLDGRTGEFRARAKFPSRDGFGTAGKPGDVAARNQLAIAYLDGKTPCIIAERGTYGLQKVMAYQLNGDELEILWYWDNADTERKFYGQGAHTLQAADLDGDGRDEVILGSSVLDDDGTPLWSTGMGHPDVCMVGDFVPDNPGLEIFYALEIPQKQNGVCMVDGRTGEILWGYPGETHHVGRGQVSNIDPVHPGCEAWAAEDANKALFGDNPPRWLFSSSGELLAEGADVPGMQVVYWDGDIQRELLQGGRPHDYKGGAHSPIIQGRVLAIADVTGDWREEIITSLPGELRIYTTTIPAKDRRPCLLQDPTYRNSVAAFSSGYYSQPMLGYTLTASYGSLLVAGPREGLSGRETNACTVTVVAPADEPLTGTLRLSTEDDARLEPDSFTVSLAAGESVRLPLSIELTRPPSPLAGRAKLNVSGTLQAETGEDLRITAALPVRDEPMTGEAVIGAGDFIEQSGGEGRLRTDKPDSGGRAFSHWNDRGHRVTWQIEVPRDGRYHLVFRYGNSFGATAERSLLVNDTPLPGAELLRFPQVGTVLDEWATLLVRLENGEPAIWELAAGTHKITMENTNDRWLNLDQIAFIPAEEN